jgi:phytoene dehydrogenase-like protein
MSSTKPIVVVGGGIAGLTAAAMLTRAGIPVTLLEQNHQVGGLMAGIWRKGFYFDVGDMSLEDGGVIFEVMRQLGLFEHQQWARADYRLKAPDFDFDVTGYDQAEAELAAAFPHEAGGLRRVFRVYRNVGRSLGRTFRTGAIPHVLEGADRFRAWPGYAWRLIRDGPPMLWASRIRAERMIAQRVDDPRLRNFLESAGYPGQATLVAAFFWRLWIHDYWHPRVGLQAMLDSVASYIVERGGEIRYKAPVDQILLRGGRIVGVRTASGEETLADTVIYTGDMKRLYCGMLAGEPKADAARRVYEPAGLTYPLLSLYLGVDVPAKRMREILRTHHTFYFPSYDLAEDLDADDPHMHRSSWIEISCPSMYGESLAPSGCSSLVVQCLTNYDFQNGWMLGTSDPATAEPRRNAAYRELKQRVTDQLLTTAEEVIPDLRKHLRYCDLGSPRSTRRFTYNSEGASSGWSWDPNKRPFGLLKWRFKTPFEGLWTAGQYTMWPGCAPAAALSAKIVADKIIRQVHSKN